MAYYLALLYFVSLLIGFCLNLTFTAKDIANNISLTGQDLKVQGCITPSFVYKLETFAFLFLICLIIYGFKSYGILFSIGVIISGFIVTALNMAILLPKTESPTYINIIYSSMWNRYANFVKNGDFVRAEAMKYFIDSFEEKGYHLKTMKEVRTD